MKDESWDFKALIAERNRRNPKAPWPHLEALLTERDLFGLVTATPLQRAICRLSDGRPLGELAKSSDVVAALGGPNALKTLPTKKPHEQAILSGIRCGKSLLAGAHAVHWSQTCDVSKLGPGEMPRVSIVSISRDQAEVIFDHVKGRVLSSNKLRQLVMTKPGVDRILLRHPTGIPVEICVVAGSKSGSALVARWSAGCIFDEFPRMNGEDDGVVNWDDQRHAVMERILPGGQLMSIGSPWAPHGPAYEIVKSQFGKPSEDIIVWKTPAWTMNPFWWTEERIENARQRPDSFMTEVLGEFASPEESLFGTFEIDSVTRAVPLELSFDPRASYRAAMDPATKGNGWTFVIVTRTGAVRKVALVREWLGSKTEPLSPRDVMAEIADICHDYRIKVVDTDQYLADANKDIAAAYGIHLRQVDMSEKEKVKKWLSFKTKIACGEIELPPDRTVRADLLQLRKKPTTHGAKIVMPKTGDGRHCDYAPALILAFAGWLEDVESEDRVLPRSEEAVKKFAETMKAQRFEAVRSANERAAKYGKLRR